VDRAVALLEKVGGVGGGSRVLERRRDFDVLVAQEAKGINVEGGVFADFVFGQEPDSDIDGPAVGA
jgi:hypothetical protein